MKYAIHLLAVAWALFPSHASAADWPQFRGPNRDGVSSETKFPLTWSPGKNIRWSAKLPAGGNSSPIVINGRVFVTCAEDPKGTKRSLYCFNADDGKQLWVRTVAYPKIEPTHQRNPYCAATPAADAKRVVVWFGSAGVVCYDHDGNELWKRDLGEFRHIWGHAASPVLHGDVVLMNCGPGARTFVTALDANTGKTLWQTDEPGGAEDRNDKGEWLGSWDSPIIAKVDGHEQVLVAQPHHVNAYDPQTGKILWTCGGTGLLAYADVMVGDGIAVAASGYTGPAIGFKLGGTGDITEANRLWRVERNPQRVGTGVVRGPHLFMVSEPGFSCIEMATGREVWKHHPKGDTFWGSIVEAGGRLYATSQKGTTYVFAADPTGYHELAVNELGEASNSTPALADGRIYLRTYGHVYCIEGQ